jgi:cobalt-zinc-cadmium efflux system membrane fusion protein
MRYQLIALITIFFLASCKGVETKESLTEKIPADDRVSLTDKQIENGSIAVGEISTRKIRTTITVNGVVDVPPQNMISVSFPMGGYLRYTKLMPGMHVSKGEVIAEMEDQAIVQLQQDYLVTQAKLTYLEKEYERQKELNEDKVNSDKTFQLTTADYTSQRIMLNGYAEKLRLIGVTPDRLTAANISRRVSVRSPINGFVSKVNVNTGKYLQPSDVLFELINPDDIHAALSIFEKDLSKVSVGQKVRISFVDEPEKEYDGEVILLNRNVDEDRLAIAHCHFLTQPKQLLPGMFLNARISVSEANVPVVPEGALVRFNNREFVFTESGKGTFHMQEVTSGAREDGMIEIREGRDSLFGKKIVTSNAYSVLGALKNTAEE